MVKQNRVGDLFPIWGEWNRLNMEVWNQTLKHWTGQCSSSEMMSLWTTLNRANEEIWNLMLPGWSQTDAFSHMMSSVAENYLAILHAFSQIAQDYSEQVLHGMHIATLDDLTHVAEMVIYLENKVDELTAEVARLAAKTMET